MSAATLQVRLLGGLELTRAGAPLPPLDSARVESLLAYLVLHRTAPQPRQHLSFLLWPDSTEAQARTNLRHLLHKLRHALPDADAFLDVTARTVQWRPDGDFTLDVAQFEAALAAARAADGGADDAAVEALRAAVQGYTGDLLDGRYDEWLLDERERLRQLYLDALERVVQLLADRGDARGALPYAERLVRQQPLHEQGYRLLIRLHHDCGNRARALRIYHECATVLQRELGVDPSPATRALYEALLPDDPADAPQQALRPVAGPPLVGRSEELAALTARWRDAEHAQAHLVLVSGEAGVGKSRLVEELAVLWAHRGGVVASARCYEAEGVLAYGPVVAWLRTPEVRGRLDRLASSHRSELARLLPDVAADDVAADEVAPHEVRPPDPPPAAEDRHRLFDAVVAVLRGVDAPALLVLDDLQWCDDETLRAIHYLLRADPPLRVAVVATAREHDLSDAHRALLQLLQVEERYAEVALRRLSQPQTAMLAEHLAGAPLEVEKARRLFDDTEGNPLFVIEALRAGWDGDPQHRTWQTPRVQAAIAVRLSALSEAARLLVDAAAVIGREFPADVVAAVSGLPEEAVVAGLDELWRRGVIRERGVNAYDFTHDKIRETAYAALSPPRRVWQHRRAAEALLGEHVADPGAVVAVLAQHYEAAGMPAEAARWYERAAEGAQRVYAPAEAVRLLERALALVRALPESRARHEHELAILTALPSPLIAVEGYLAPRVRSLQQRARELALLLGTEPEAPLLRSLAIGGLADDDFAAAERFATELRDRGQRTGDDVLVTEAEYVLGVTAFWQGQLHAARTHLAAAVDSYRPQHGRIHLLRYGQDPKVMCLMRLGYTLWFLGHVDSALAMRDRAVEMAESLGHPYTRMVAVTFAALLAVDLRDEPSLRRLLKSFPDGELPHGPQSQLTIELLAGYADVLGDPAGGGLGRMRRGRDGLVTGVPAAPGIRAVARRMWLAGCAAADDASATLDAVDALDAEPAARPWAAEGHLLRAWALGRRGATAEAVEGELRRAVDVAHAQDARTLELRAVTSLLRHQCTADRPGTDATRQRLARLLDALPEPPSSAPDLADARDVLAGERPRNARAASSSS